MAISPAEKVYLPQASTARRRRSRAVKSRQPLNAGCDASSPLNRKAAGKLAKKPANRARKSESEEKFAVVFDKATLPMALARLPGGEVVDVNEEWVKLFGFTKKEAAGKTSVELRISRDSKQRAQIFREIQKRGFVRYEGAQFFTKRGEARTIDCNMKYVTLGAQKYVLSTLRDVTEQKRAEEELRRSEVCLAQGQRLSQTGSWALNVATSELFWSEEHFRIVGLDSARGTPGYPGALKVIHPDDRALVVQTLERAIRDKTEFETECRLVRPDGTIRFVRSLAQPVFDNAGQVVEYVGTVIDITEQIRAEEDLRRSEAYLAEAQRLSHTGSGAWNVITGELFWSDESYRICGFNRGTITPTAEVFFGIVHPEDRAWLQDEFTVVVAEKRDYDLLFRIVRPDGMVRWIHSIGHSRSNQAGEVVEVLGTVMDITEPKEAEERLAESERRFRLLAETLPQHVWSYNPDGSASYFNRQWLDYTGISFAQARGNGGHQVVHPDDMAATQMIWRQARKEGKPFEMELRLRGKDGKYRRFFIQGAPFLSDTGEILEWHGTNTDIEDRKQAEEALQQARTKLEKVAHVSAMGEMAAAISHEINQPLGAIVNNSSYCLQLLGKSEGEAKKRAALEDIATDANRASAIISRIRSLTNGSVPEITKLNFRDLITEVVTLAQRGLTEHRIEVKTAVAKNLPNMSGDRVHLQQVLLNLVVNAIEAMSGADQRTRLLTIRAAPTTLHRNPAIAVTVADTGAGFGKEAAEQMFDAFYSTKTGGMGMGLRISRTIVEGHGGRLSGRRNKRKGSTFSFVLPVKNSSV